MEDLPFEDFPLTKGYYLMQAELTQNIFNLSSQHSKSALAWPSCHNYSFLRNQDVGLVWPGCKIQEAEEEFRSLFSAMKAETKFGDSWPINKIFKVIPDHFQTKNSISLSTAFSRKMELYKISALLQTL